MVAQNERPASGGLPDRRVILLGASNLARGIATIVDACHRLWGQPLDVLAAIGHGRSYGTRSTVLCRSLPSILHSDLWSAVAERGPAPTAALVSDIGNDLLYEAPVERIVDWVSGCLDKLEGLEARVVMTRLPMDNIEHVPPWKFRLLRRLMFPRGTLSYETIAGRARELDERLRTIAAERNVKLVEQSRAWYSWDPIHIKSEAWPQAWHHILSGWSESPPPPAGHNAGLDRMIYLRTRVPRQRWWFGIEQRGRQPSGRLAEGSVVSFF